MKRRSSSAARHAAAAVEHERRRVSQEMHRHLNQSLTGLSLMLEAVAAEEDVQGHEAEVTIPGREWLRILELAQIAVRDAHRLHDRLAPLSRKHLDLHQALHKLVDDAGFHLAGELHFDPAVVERVTSVEVQTALYRIAQEAIDNVVRHAKASRLEVRCEVGDGLVRLEISDDGQGVAARAIKSSDGGWYSMEQHAKSIGASLRMDRRAGGGTLVECVAPC